MINASNFVIRPAREADTPLILVLIKELADYERLSHEFVATEEDIRQSLFGDRPFAEALIGEFENNPISFALFFYNFSTFNGKPGIYLEDLYVKPAYRNRGFGRRMLAHIAHLMHARRQNRTEQIGFDIIERVLHHANRMLGNFGIRILKGHCQNHTVFWNRPNLAMIPAMPAVDKCFKLSSRTPVIDRCTQHPDITIYHLLHQSRHIIL